VTVIEGVPAAMVKAAFDASDTGTPAASRAVTRTRPFDVAGPGDAHVQLWIAPASAEHPGTATYVAPPSLELSTSKRLPEPVALQGIRGDDPGKGVPPPSGPVTGPPRVGAAAPAS